MDTLIHYIQTILVWLLQFVDWILIEIFSVVGAAAVAVLAAIPVPGFFATASTSLGSLPSGVLYFAQAIDLGTGLTSLMTAVGLRFLIRRIPFIG